jgi:hypothetical protein
VYILLPQYGQFSIPIIPLTGKHLWQNGHRQKRKKNTYPIHTMTTPAIDSNGISNGIFEFTKSAIINNNNPITINILPMAFTLRIFSILFIKFFPPHQ